MTTSSRPSLVVSFAVAIERLYEVFGRYPRPRGETYSAYSDVTATDAAAIRERPLRELSGRDLAKYAMRAVVTWGDADELRYYLPRLLELLVIERGWQVVPSQQRSRRGPDPPRGRDVDAQPRRAGHAGARPPAPPLAAAR